MSAFADSLHFDGRANNGPRELARPVAPRGPAELETLLVALRRLRLW